jgi:NADH:ubiquinone oxidoreductase subunit C
VAETVGERVQAALPGAGITVEPFPGTAGRVGFAPAAALDVFRYVHGTLGYDHLSFVGGIDWVEEREVVYLVWSDARREYLLLSTRVPAAHAHVESATPVWPSANWHEREAWEMVDIHFDHHPDLRHLLMPDGYAFHPLLRSFKLHEPEELEVKVRHV